MINIEKVVTYGWTEAIRGMRNPLNSWDRSDSDDFDGGTLFEFEVGPNDHDLMMRLAKGGPSHAKYRRMISVYADITAPLYWWKEFDTYKVGTVANSCSTMHKIHAKEFTADDFSCDHLFEGSRDQLELLIGILNLHRDNYINFDKIEPTPCVVTKKDYWWQMIQLLPSSYNQKRTVMFNYEVLNNMYHSRKNHKLDEWVEFCKWVETLPYSELITGKEG